ncbi:MAG: hypothetical protein EXS64_08365 [Candidatus Latescibacteria bacterium]|nr:hypothetical protein [Candidatus Latescibacterota bacterium]
MRSRVPIVVSMIVGFIVGAGGGILAAKVGSYGGEGTSRQRLTKEAACDKLTQQLQLTPSQRDSLNVILDDGRKHMKELSQVFRPKFREIKAQTRDRIRGILDPNQREAFEKIVEEEDRKREAQKKADAVQDGAKPG